MNERHRHCSCIRGWCADESEGGGRGWSLMHRVAQIVQRFDPQETRGANELDEEEESCGPFIGANCSEPVVTRQIINK
eukprot:6155925-Prymnesium_polylepis.3